MERIGLAASKIARGNIWFYNLNVIIISIFFSLFIFFISATSIILALIILSYIVNGIMPTGFEKSWPTAFRICIITLTVLVSLLNLFAILKNMKWSIKQK